MKHIPQESHQIGAKPHLTYRVSHPIRRGISSCFVLGIAPLLGFSPLPSVAQNSLKLIQKIAMNDGMGNSVEHTSYVIFFLLKTERAPCMLRVGWPEAGRFFRLDAEHAEPRLGPRLVPEVGGQGQALGLQTVSRGTTLKRSIAFLLVYYPITG